MKRIYFLLLVALFFSCKGKKNQVSHRIDYRYRIKGEVTVKGKPHPAIWMTDTFDIKEDSIIITNSDNSTYRIGPPYQVYSIK